MHIQYIGFRIGYERDAYPVHRKCPQCGMASFKATSGTCSNWEPQWASERSKKIEQAGTAEPSSDQGACSRLSVAKGQDFGPESMSVLIDLNHTLFLRLPDACQLRAQVCAIPGVCLGVPGVCLGVLGVCLGCALGVPGVYLGVLGVCLGCAWGVPWKSFETPKPFLEPVKSF